MITILTIEGQLTGKSWRRFAVPEFKNQDCFYNVRRITSLITSVLDVLIWKHAEFFIGEQVKEHESSASWMDGFVCMIANLESKIFNFSGDSLG